MPKFFGSLLFDHESYLAAIALPTFRFGLCSVSIGIISLTQIGAFSIGDKPKGMPKPIKFILDKFSQGRRRSWISELF